MRHTLLPALLASSWTLTATAQTSLVVPDNFPDIGSAIAAASPGAVIHVKSRPLPYPPFVIDKPITIVGSGVDQGAPMVSVTVGIGIDVQLAPGERASITRIDCMSASGATLTRALVVNGGHLTLEDCRFFGGHDPVGGAGLAVVEAIGADLVAVFSRFEGGTRATALRATTSRVSVVSTRCFGANPDSPGIDAIDSTVHGNDAWLLGGESFVGTPGGPALRVAGASSVWFCDSQMRGGMGTPAGSAIVNTSATAVEIDNNALTSGLSLGGATPPPVIVGPSLANPNLVALRWSEQLYRRGTMRMGQPWWIYLRGTPSSSMVLGFSFGPTGSAPVLTRQPALLHNDLLLLLPLASDAAGNASFAGGTLPNSASLFGAGLWAQAATLGSFPVEASPPSGVVVRPY